MAINPPTSQNEARLQLAYCRLLSNAPRAAAILEGLLASKAPLPRSQCLDVQKFVGEVGQPPRERLVVPYDWWESWGFFVGIGSSCLFFWGCAQFFWKGGNVNIANDGIEDWKVLEGNVTKETCSWICLHVAFQKVALKFVFVFFVVLENSSSAQSGVL